MKAFTTTIQSKRTVARGTVEVVLARPKDFEFTAGQYIQVALKRLYYPDPKGRSRTFSICSSPFETETVAIAFRDTNSGYKQTLQGLHEGSEVVLNGPFGHFVLPKSQNSNHVFIAGGIGITPFLSMIESEVTQESHARIALIYANRDEESAAYLECLRGIDATAKDFSLDAIFERINMDHIQKYMGDKNNTFWWIVGPPGMVAEVKHILGSLGIPDSKIRIEDFIGY